MTYLNMTATTRLPAILKQALSYARLATGADGLRGLGSTQADVNYVLSVIVNECQRDFFDRFNTLGEKSGTIAMTAGVRSSDIPLDLRDTDIIRLYYTDGDWAGRTIKMETVANLELVNDWFRNRESSGEYDEFCAVFPPHDNTKVYWYPMPSESRTIGVVYRDVERQFLESDITDPDGTICAIPDRMIPLFAIMVAIEISNRTSGGDQNMNAASLREQFERKALDWEEKLLGYQGAITNDTLEWGGYPKSQDDVRAQSIDGWYE